MRCQQPAQLWIVNSQHELCACASQHQHTVGQYEPDLKPCLGVQVKHDLAKLQLTSPVCTKEQEKIALSRRVEKHWRLIGWGQIQKGAKMDLPGRDQ